MGKVVKGRKDMIPKNKEGSDLIRPDGGENLILRMKAIQTRFYFLIIICSLAYHVFKNNVRNRTEQTEKVPQNQNLRFRK